LIEVGELRPFSDVAGRHALRLNNSPKKRFELVERLNAAGCEISIAGKADWLTEGNFENSQMKQTPSAQ